MNITGKTQLFALVGHPVRHSLSPAMYNHLFAEHGIDAVYVAFDVDPARGSGLAASLRTLDIRGVNLTVPFKRTIMADLHHATGAAKEAMACNVVIQQDGQLVGYNTDGEGFVRGIEEEFGSQAGKTAIVLGAGGAARAVAAGLADRGARRVTFFNRSIDGAETSARHLASCFPETEFGFEPLDLESFEAHAGSAGLVVNAAAGGAKDTIAKLPVDRLSSDAIWCDINYWMPDPPNLAAARTRGLRVQDGLAMLAHQGALSFELFTGVPVEAAHIRARLGSMVGGGRMADIPELVCTRGALAGRRFVATETHGLKIGRADDNDVVIQDDGVSRFHAELLYNNGSLWLRDAGSRNGVFVNGNRVMGHQALKVGDEITIAEHGFSVRWDGDPTEERPAPKKGTDPQPETAPKPSRRRWFWPFS